MSRLKAVLPGFGLALMPGSFTRATMVEALIAVAPVCLGAAPLLWLGFRLDLLSLGDEQAQSPGLPARRLRRTVLATAALMTSAAVPAAVTP